MPRKNRLAIFQPVVVLLGIVFGGSCGPANTATSPSTSQPATTLDVSSLDFETPKLKELFQNFDRVAREATTETGWRHRDYSDGGNFVSAVWALGKGYDDDCHLSREPQHQVGTRKIDVDAVVVEGKAKSAALTLELVDSSPKEWCVFCNYRETAEENVTGGGWGVKLFKWDAEKQKSHIPFRPYEQTTAKLELGPRYNYHVLNTPVEIASDLPQDKDFLRYLASAESLRDAYLEASARLLKKIEETIAQHKAERRIFGKYNGDGRPPPSHLRKLTAEEEVEELAKAREQFARQDKLVKDEYVAMHAVLRKTFPFEKCWPELSTTAAK